MDSKLPLEFLSTPRTVSEIAERLNVSAARAEQLILEAMRSGRVRASSPSFGAGRGEGRLPRATGRKVSAHLNLNDYGKLRFELRRLEPSPIVKDMRPAALAAFLGAPKKPARVHSMSPSLLIRLLELVEKSPKSLAKIVVDMEVSRRTMERLVRKGLVKEIWGPKGVGLSYGISPQGLRELESLRRVLDSADKLVRRPLPTLKARAAP